MAASCYEFIVHTEDANIPDTPMGRIEHGFVPP